MTPRSPRSACVPRRANTPAYGVAPRFPGPAPAVTSPARPRRRRPAEELLSCRRRLRHRASASQAGGPSPFRPRSEAPPPARPSTQPAWAAAAHPSQPPPRRQSPRQSRSNPGTPCPIESSRSLQSSPGPSVLQVSCRPVRQRARGTTREAVGLPRCILQIVDFVDGADGPCFPEASLREDSDGQEDGEEGRAPQDPRTESGGQARGPSTLRLALDALRGFDASACRRGGSTGRAQRHAHRDGAIDAARVGEGDRLLQAGVRREGADAHADAGRARRLARRVAHRRFGHLRQRRDAPGPDGGAVALAQGDRRDPALRAGLRRRVPVGGAGRSAREHAARGHVLGRPLRERDGPVRAHLGDRHAREGLEPGGDAQGRRGIRGEDALVVGRSADERELTLTPPLGRRPLVSPYLSGGYAAPRSGTAEITLTQAWRYTRSIAQVSTNVQAMSRIVSSAYCGQSQCFPHTASNEKPPICLQSSTWWKKYPASDDVPNTSTKRTGTETRQRPGDSTAAMSNSTSPQTCVQR